MAINFLFGWANSKNVEIPTKANGETDIGKLFEMYNNEMNNQSKKASPNAEKLDLLSLKDKEYLNKLDTEEIKKAVAFEREESPLEVINTLYGPEYKGYKGQDAVNKLLAEKQGHIKGAFHRNDIGYIDLIWGNDNLGLKHIIKRREEEKPGHSKIVLDNLTETIQKASLRKVNNRGNFEFVYKNGKTKYFVIIAPEYHGTKITYVLSAFNRT